MRLNGEFIGWGIGTAFFALCCIGVPYVLGTALISGFLVWFGGIPLVWGWTALILAIVVVWVRHRRIHRSQVGRRATGSRGRVTQV